MSESGILKVYFDTFSSKNEYRVTFTNNYNQSCSVDFRACSSNGKEKDYESGFHYYGARYYWSEVLTGWLSVDPMADKYPNVSPYNYCAWNPVRIVDPDGQDGWDKVAGFCIGILTNVSSRTGWLRDAYTPTNSVDYNSSLRAADNTMMVAGGIMTVAGAAGVAAGSTIIGGGAAVSMTGIGAPEGVAVMAAGAAVDVASAVTSLVGSAVTMQATANASQGYDRGNSNNNGDVQTSAGRKTDRYGNVLGPSGKPQVNKVHHTNQKQAKDAARNEGKGKPVKHATPTRGRSHYHPTNTKGEKKPNSTHHEY